MSTKFSVRPAPRKKPWICKRSPPCLPPPPLPPSLLCSFYFRRINPPNPGDTIHGTLLLVRQGTSNLFKGYWKDGTDYFNAQFKYWTADSTGQAWGGIQAGPYPDLIQFDRLPIALPPLLYYAAADNNPDTEVWVSRITVTS